MQNRFLALMIGGIVTLIVLLSAVFDPLAPPQREGSLVRPAAISRPAPERPAEAQEKPASLPRP
jgi:hypothetical protein